MASSDLLAGPLFFSWDDSLPTDGLSVFEGSGLPGLGPSLYETIFPDFNMFEDPGFSESVAAPSPAQHLNQQVLLVDGSQQSSVQTSRTMTSELSSISSLVSSLPETPTDVLLPSPYTSTLELWTPSSPETGRMKRKLIDDDDDDEDLSVSDEEGSADEDFDNDSSDEEEEHTIRPTRRTRVPPAKRRRVSTVKPSSSSSYSSSSLAPPVGSRCFVCEQPCTTCDRRESKGQGRKTFTRSSDRLRHYRSTARARTFDCPVCGLQLSRKDALHRHKSTCPGA
jgi:hypothetical protein